MSFSIDVRGRGAGKTYDALTAAIKKAQRDAYLKYVDARNAKQDPDYNKKRYEARVLYVTTTGQSVESFELLKIVANYCKEQGFTTVYIVEKNASVIRIIDSETEVIVHVEHFNQELVSRVRPWQFNAMVQDGEFLPDLLLTLRVGSAWGIYVGDYVPLSLFDWMKDATDIHMSATIGV